MKDHNDHNKNSQPASSTQNTDLGDFFSDENMKGARANKWYSEIANNVNKCVFCDLREKYFVDRLETCVLTVSLFPYIDGQMMVIPFRHLEEFKDISVDEWKEIRVLTEMGIRLIKDGLGYSDVNVLYREGGPTSGKSVGHFHIHILPVTKEFITNTDKGFEWKFQEIKLSLKEMADKLRKISEKLNGK